MYTRRKIRWSLILRFTWKNLLLFTLWSTFVTCLYKWLVNRGTDISLPFLPLSTIGIAVAFYISFKNSRSYDRFWEGRKVWGSIVNLSRIWSNQVLSYITNPPGQPVYSAGQLHDIQQALIYRHLAWVNALRIQLRHTTMMDRINLTYMPDLNLRNEEDCEEKIGAFLDSTEYEDVIKKVNMNSQLLRNQGDALKKLAAEGCIDNFIYCDLMKTLQDLYERQGACERIKNTPFPRQYASFSHLVVWLFVLLLPLGLLREFAMIEDNVALWQAVPYSVLISWIYTMMEIIGDSSEDPFENYIHDVPMTALCRIIEIDLREMLGETNLPSKLQPVNDVLL
jgi:putative membrane protein